MLSTARLKELNRQEQNHRKFACVMNDVARTKQEIYEGFLDKEKQEAAQRCQKSIVVTRRDVVRRRVLQKCMKTTRDTARKQIKISMTDKYGRYNGICVDQISDNIDEYIEQDHPRIRKQKKQKKLFEKGYEKGAIINNDLAERKVHKYFEKPLVELYMKRERNDDQQKDDRTFFLPPLASGFYTGSFVDWAKSSADETDLERDASNTDSLFVKRKVKKFLEDIPDNLSVQSEVPVMEKRLRSKSKMRPITLPPIKVGTDNSTADGKPKEDCISDLIAKLSHAKEKREKESKLRKERRAKRLQHDRVVHARWDDPDKDSEVAEVAENYLVVEGFNRNLMPR